jgi:predicted RNase H-related nuclease YkuK (DUF458 family)
MERYFRLEAGGLVNIVDHTLEQIATQDNLRIYVATDSQVHRKTVTFATVIVYRYGTRGAHYIFHREDTPKKKGVGEYERLFEEAVRTIQTAQMLRENHPIEIEALEFDYNEVKKTKSQPLISTVKGWVLGLGMTPVFKSGQMIASKAGDHLCRKREKLNLEFSNI